MSLKVTTNENYNFNHYNCIESLTKYFGKTVLDYGCGTGLVTALMARYAENSIIVGYDSQETGEHFNKELIINAKKRCQEPNVDITDKLGDDAQFDSVVLMCMLHGNENIISQAKKYLKTGGEMIVFDHDKSHLSPIEFSNFISPADLSEIKDRSFEEVYMDHTKMGINDCKRIAEKENIYTVDEFDHKDFGGHPFYLWVGQKEN